MATSNSNKSPIKKDFYKEITFEELDAAQFDKDKLLGFRFDYANSSKHFYFLDPDFNKIKRVAESSDGKFKWSCVYETNEGDIVSQLSPLKISIRGNKQIFLALTFLFKPTKLLKFQVMKEIAIKDSIYLDKVEDQPIELSKIEEYNEIWGMFSMIEELKDGCLIIGARSLEKFFELSRQWCNQEPSYALAGFYTLPCKTIRMCKIECTTHGAEYLAFILEDRRLALIYIKGRTEFGKLNLIYIQYIDLLYIKPLFLPSHLSYVKNLDRLLVCNLQKNLQDKQFYPAIETFKLNCGTFNSHFLEFDGTLFSSEEKLLPRFSVFDEDECNESLLLVASADLKKLLIYGIYKSDRIFLIRGKDGGRPAWHYVLVESRQKHKDLKNQRKGSNIDVADYGKIVKSGWGVDPSKEIMEEIEEKYGE